MNFVTNYYKLISPRVSNVYKFGGYLSRNIASVEDYNIKWKRPERILISDPKQTGDLGLDITVDPSEIKLYYQNSKELEDASPLIKKMFSVQFDRQIETRNIKREKIMALVKRHVCDRGSIESKIAAMTSTILDHQNDIQETRNKRTKIFLKELIERRKKYIKLIRRWDYARYEWLLERLNLVFKPQPLVVGPVSRKDSIRKMTQDYCDDIVNKKLEAYKTELKKQQKAFYIEKAEKLAFILKEEKECGIALSVTEEDIEMARNKAEQLLESDKV